MTTDSLSNRLLRLLTCSGWSLLQAALWLVLGYACVVSTADAQTGNLIPVRRPVPQTQLSPTTQSIDADTFWTFRLKGEVVLASPIVRLGDVIVPLDPNLPGWSRMARSAVGLLPVDGQVMRIDRERITKVILSAEATPRKIHWVGDGVAEVSYRPDVAQTEHTITQQADFTNTRANTGGQSNQAASIARTNQLSPDFAERIVQWIELAVDRENRNIRQRYEVSIDSSQPALQQLESARGIELAQFTSEIRNGVCQLRVVSRGLEGGIEAEVVAKLTQHPVAVVPVRNLRRGHRITAMDLTERPIPSAQWEDGFLTDRNDLIGLEVQGNLRENEPVTYGSVGKPTLVRRGDLLEVRVVNGSISVTTNAKAMGDGAESDLIEIETLQPRKRLVARVIRSGLVEIMTRSPRTQ